MLPILGRGEQGAKRGVKLALIAGIKKNLYDAEAVVAYLLYRLNILNPTSLAYLKVFPEGSALTTDVDVFFEQLAARLGMRMRGGDVDTSRAAKWFVDWWRREGGLISAASAARSIVGRQRRQGLNIMADHASDKDDAHQLLGPFRRGWGFNFEWTVDGGGVEAEDVGANMSTCIDAYLKTAAVHKELGVDVSPTQEKKLAWEEKLAKSAVKSRARVSRKSG